MLHCPRSIARAILCSGLVLAAVPALAADPTGDWRVADGVANIRVAQCNGNMWGAVSWEKTPGGRDSNNPDASRQSRPTLGMPILIDMKKKPAVDQWDAYVGMDNQLKTLTCSEFEVRAFAGGQGGSLNYVVVKDLVADQKLKDRRAKARAQQSPTSSP